MSQSNNANLKNALCYVPFVAFILFFLEADKTADLLKNIKYGAGLFIAYFVLNFIAGLFGLSTLIFVAYLIASIYLGYKAYVGDAIEIEWMDVLEDKIKKGFEVK